MKIRLYILNYNNDEALTGTLDSLYDSDIVQEDFEFFILNNHSNINVKLDRPQLTLMNNVCRPDFSCGHHTRSWNQALLNGFEDLSNPACDLVIACHNDTLFYPDWFSYIKNLLEKYTFIQMGDGDNLMIWKPEAVKKIGIWDERFCGGGYQEADYFLRAVSYNREFSSINDGHHGRRHNQEENKCVDTSFSHHPGTATARKVTQSYHEVSKIFFEKKWPGMPHPIIGEWELKDGKFPVDDYLSPSIDSYITYPYFEKHIDRETQKLLKYFYIM